MNETVVRTTVPTYDGTYGASQRPSGGHGDPQVAVEVKFCDGIDITLNADLAPAAPNVFIERRLGGWYLNVSPDGGDAAVEMRISDKGGLEVHSGVTGRLVLKVEAPGSPPAHLLETPQ